MVETASQTSLVGASAVLDREHCLALLRTTGTGHIVVVLDEQPMSLQVAHVMDGEYVVFRVASTWRKPILHEDSITFTSESSDGRSVTVQGHVDVIDGLPLLPPPGFERSDHDLHGDTSTVWVRIRPEIITGTASALSLS